MLVGLIRKRAGTSKFLSAPLFAIPAALVAEIVAAMVSTVLRAAGVAGDSFLQDIFGFASFIAVGYATACLLARSSKSGPSYRRGTVVMSGESAGEAHRSDHPQPGSGSATDPNAPLSLAGIRIANEDETKHFKFIGTTGTGKSTAIREILSGALARGDRAVIADPDGGYLHNFYDSRRGDIILNPFTPEGVKWNALDEIKNDQDVDQLARSLIPDNGDPDRTWSEHARAFFIAVTQQALLLGVKDDAELYRLLTKAPVKELKILLAGTSAGPLLEDGNERMFGSERVRQFAPSTTPRGNRHHLSPSEIGSRTEPRPTVVGLVARSSFRTGRARLLRSAPSSLLGFASQFSKPWTGGKAINACGSWSMSLMRWAKSTG
jgi:hypothetical protein